MARVVDVEYVLHFLREASPKEGVLISTSPRRRVSDVEVSYAGASEGSGELKVELSPIRPLAEDRWVYWDPFLIVSPIFDIFNGKIKEITEYFAVVDDCAILIFPNENVLWDLIERKVSKVMSPFDWTPLSVFEKYNISVEMLNVNEILSKVRNKILGVIKSNEVIQSN